MFDITATMRFRPPEGGLEVVQDLEGRFLIDNPSIQPYTGFIVASEYRKNPDGTVDITALYHQQDFTEQMTRMGCQIATKGLGIGGWEGVIDFYPKLHDIKRAIRKACL